jgi:hypothetical protein
MPSYAELAAYRDRNPEEWDRYWAAAGALYRSLEHADIQAAVDNTPNMLASKLATFAALIGLGYGDPAIHAKVVAKLVEMRLAS